MRDISLHLLDIIQNSIRAQANNIFIDLDINAKGLLRIEIKDDGHGIGADMLENITDPFVTSRTTRRVGLGIPLFKENAELTGGSLEIKSQEGAGTEVIAIFNMNSIDCLPLGDIAGTMASLVLGCPEKPDFILNMSTQKGALRFDTREMRSVLQEVPLNTPEVIAYIKTSLQEEIESITQ